MTEFGIVTDVSPEFINALLPIDVTVLGIIKTPVHEEPLESKPSVTV